MQGQWKISLTPNKQIHTPNNFQYYEEDESEASDTQTNNSDSTPIAFLMTKVQKTNTDKKQIPPLHQRNIYP